MCVFMRSVIKIVLQFCKENGLNSTYQALQTECQVTRRASAAAAAAAAAAAPTTSGPARKPILKRPLGALQQGSTHRPNPDGREQGAYRNNGLHKCTTVGAFEAVCAPFFLRLGGDNGLFQPQAKCLYPPPVAVRCTLHRRKQRS